MPIPSPLHDRTSALCRSLRWKDWSGYHAVCAYDTYPEREYFAIRHAAGLQDVTPLYKYDITGPDATSFLSRVMTRNIAKLKLGQVTYCCWCDERGKVLDDGTVWRIEDSVYRATAAEPSLRWFHHNARGLDVTITDVTEQIAALSVQGPRAREILREVVGTAVDDLRFFRLLHGKLGKADLIVTRTGYTGDLGFEVWIPNKQAPKLWDALMEAGQPYGIMPNGLDALDICRVEAGFIMNGVDYFSANHCVIESRTSSPYEAGLGWTVHLDREPFVGQAALRDEKSRGPAWQFVGLEMDWDEFETLHDQYGLPPEICTAAWRSAVPVYARDGRQVGQATSGAWSPMLKKNLALATLRTPFAQPGTELRMETTVEYVRHSVKVTVAAPPFFDPPRKRTT